MLYQFQIVPSAGIASPSSDYFQDLQSAALAAVQANQSLQGAWRVCEYLDSVDSGDLAMDKGLYGSCVSYLSDFLGSHSNAKNVRALTSKSWAAHTLHQLLVAEEERVRKKSLLRRVA